MARPDRPMRPQHAEILALDALAWLAGDVDGLQRFLDMSGTDAAALRDGAGTPAMNGAILDFLLAQEDLLLRFCESAGISPKALHLALHRMNTGGR